MKKLLVIQSRTTPQRIENEQKNFIRSVGGLADIVFVSSLDEQVSWTKPEKFLADFDGVIFGGSSDFDFHGGRAENDPVRLMSLLILSRTKDLVSYLLAEEMPLLGVCYGHQLIANIYGGEVNHDKEQSKFGLFKVSLTEEGQRDPLFKGLPDTFMAQYAHKDSVTILPRGATLLASAEGCRFSALRYGPAAYTLQFHPEVVRFEDPAYHHEESPEASRIIPLWIERIVGP